jgi:hypothetical protein
LSFLVQFSSPLGVFSPSHNNVSLVIICVVIDDWFD